MIEKPEILRMAGALATNAAVRQVAIARNVANADTPGYRAVDAPDFATTYRSANSFRPFAPDSRDLLQGSSLDGLTTSRIIERPDAGATSPDGNTVTLEGEMVSAAEARQSHDMALAIYKVSLGILRASLGRG